MTKWRGNFCWYGEDHILYTSATTERKAYQQMCHQLAKKLEYSQRHIALYFRETPNKYRMEEETDEL